MNTSIALNIINELRLSDAQRQELANNLQGKKKEKKVNVLDAWCKDHFKTNLLKLAK